MPANQSLQENVLVLMCFSEEFLPALVTNITEDLFENRMYRDIISTAKKYYLEYRQPIGEHLADKFARQLASRNRREADDWKSVLTALHEMKDAINPRFVMDELNKFMREQSLKLKIRKSVAAYEDNNLDLAERLLKEESIRLKPFDPGIFFAKDLNATLHFMTKEDDLFDSGIRQFDDLGISPARGELYTVVALPGFGKSWYLIYIGKNSILQRKKVVHLTLEMGRDKVSMRYVQSFLSIAKNSREMRNAMIAVDERGYMTNVSLETLDLGRVLTFTDEGIIRTLQHKLTTQLRNPTLIIQQFPTGQLTMDMLRSYLENLQAYNHVFPDVLIVDYADLMYLDSAHLRVDTGRIYKDLRGLAQEYNIAVITASQANRQGENTPLLTRKNLAEDFSKVAISDNVITYNQTVNERKLGLARLYSDKARNDRRGDTVLITQNYNLGQFCLQSALVRGNYTETIENVVTQEGLQ